MNDKASELRSQLIRNLQDLPREHLLREPLYDSRVAGVSA